MKTNNLTPKVLIAAPVSVRHKHLIDSWLKHLDSLTYPNFDVLLVDNSNDNGKYFKELKSKKVKNKGIEVFNHKWNSKELNPLQMLAHVREKIRVYFLENNYDYLFWLDDDIFIPKNGIQRLLSHDKDCVGFYVHVFYKPNRVPCILKSGEIVMGKGLEYYSFSEINAYKDFVKKFRKNELSNDEKKLIPFVIKDVHRPQLFRAYAIGIGCLMVKKEVMEKTKFETHDSFIWGEDMWWYANAQKNNVEMWCDSSVRAKHENTEWESVMGKSKRNLGFFVAQGPSDASGVEIIDRRKKK